MLRAVLAALTLGAAVATPAVAGPPNHDHYFDGGCSFYAAAPTSADPFTGVLLGLGHAYSMWYEHNPVTVSYLSCDLRVNGVSVATTSAAGIGPVVVVPPQPFSYTTGPFDVVELCESYELVDAHGGTTTVTGRCAETMPLWIPPRQVNDVNDYYVGPAFGQVDLLVCAALEEAAPTQVRDLARIELGGDVYVAETLVYDCPPYE